MKAGPNDVTINVPNAGNLDTRKMLPQMPKWLRSYSVQMSNSNGKMRILIRNYDRDLSDLEPCFPDLRFESTDAENRVIEAKRKESPGKP